MTSPTSPTTPFSIRPATKCDLPILVDMQQKMCIETEGRELKTETITRGLLRALEVRQFGARVFVVETSTRVAKSEQEQQEEEKNDDAHNPIIMIIGMMMNTTEFDLHRNGYIIWFQSVYVDPRYRRQGIFRSFFAFVKNQVDTDPSCVSIRLDVDCTNERAQATYRSMGMHPEGVRIVRYTKPGVEPESVVAEKQRQQQQQQEQELVDKTMMIPLLENPNGIKVRRILPCSENETLLAVPLAKIHFDSATKYFPTTYVNKNFFDKTLPAMKRLLNKEEDVGAEVYVAENNDNGEILASAIFTYEWSDWRDGLVLNCFGTFSPNLERNNNNKSSGNILLRQDCFRSFFRTLKKRTLVDSDVSGIRFSFEEKVEKELYKQDGENEAVFDQVCVEEGMFVERYYLMRYDKV